MMRLYNEEKQRVWERERARERKEGDLSGK